MERTNLLCGALRRVLAQPDLWKRVLLAVLIVLNVAAATFVTLDLRRRLTARRDPPAVVQATPVPTMIPPPTAVVAAALPSSTPRPTVRPSPLRSASPRPTRAAPTAAPDPSATPEPAASPTRSTGFPAVLIDDGRFTFAPEWYAAEVQTFLEAQDSVLAGATVEVGQIEDTFAHALAGHCIRYGLNPRVLLTLLEVQSGLVRQSTASEQELEWAYGYQDSGWRGLHRQMQWATYALVDGFRHAEEDERPVLTDGTLAPIPGEANPATRAVLRLLAYTADAERFSELRSDGEGSFIETYRELFVEDPRLPLEETWEPARQPFLWTPFAGSAPVSAYFDHDSPIFRENGSLLTYTGDRGSYSYDGHDGWDYALAGGTPVLAAAGGQVAFAGWVDTLCSTPAGLVVLDHGQGYRTLYWHLQRIDAVEGMEVQRGERIGTVGSTGCSTGPHLHFGVEFLGRDTDPYGWCGSEEVPEDPWVSQPAGTVSRWLWADRPSPCPVPAEAVVVADEDIDRFTRSPALWYEAPVGHAGHSFWAYAVESLQESTHRAIWRPILPVSGRYFLYAYIPWYDTGRPDTTQARYRIHHETGETTVIVDQAHSTGLWVPLGSYSFAAGFRGYVYLDEITGDPGMTVWFDAILWVQE